MGELTETSRTQHHSCMWFMNDERVEGIAEEAEKKILSRKGYQRSL